MSMSHEEAMQLLSSMFESWERETLLAVFESNGYHVERTIESIIGMEQPELVAPEPSASSQQQQPHLHSEPLADLLFEEYDQTPSQPAPAHSSTQSKLRGARVQLPDDFLRLPKAPVDNVFLEDEQLALMLQNELFQEQVSQLLGNDFRDGLRRNQGLRQTGQREGGQSQREGGHSASGDGSGDILGIPDMGILTSLKGMGAGMKNQLNQLALNFNNSNNKGASSRASRLDDESRPLTALNYEEEEDDEDDYNNYSSNSRGGKKDK